MKTLYILVVAVVTVGGAHATVINVPDDQPTIQAGINAATDGDTVLVQPNTYFENINYNGKNIVVGSLFLTTQDTSYISQTVIDGNQNGSVVTFVTEEDSSAVLCGFTITNGQAQYGGGIHCYYASPTLADVIITDNSADDHGGGIYGHYHSRPVLKNSTVSGNTAADCGGGIYLNDHVELCISDCSIDDNNAQTGGGILCNYYSTLSIGNSTISNNSATESGGGVTSWTSNLSLDGVLIEDDSAISMGGGVSCYNSSVSVLDCQVTGNECQNGIVGGIICTFNDPSDTFLVTIANTSFESNRSTGTGGGLRVDHWESTPISVSVYVEDCAFIDNAAESYTGLAISGLGVNLNVVNCFFMNNESTLYSAGAAFGGSTTGVVANCLFASNVADTGGGGNDAGGVSVWNGANIDFMNCTFADNSAAYGAGLTVGGGGIASTTNCIFWGNSEDQIALDAWENQGGTLTVNYCDVQGGMDSVNVIDPISSLNWGIGNVDADPLFVDETNGDFHLSDASPCIGVGTDSIEIVGTWHYAPSSDIDGNPRPDPPGSNPDMGAYESEEGVTVERLQSNAIPDCYALGRNYPNPFGSTTTIPYQLPESASVKFSVYNLNGRLVGTLVNENLKPGYYSITWDAGALSSGVYVYRIRTGEFSATHRCVVFR